jgi:cellulose biosynthesis protein BcsQ
MGAAALAARIRLPVATGSGVATSHTLRFDALDGPLVAVCGLVGGSGASTLAFALARQVARESAAPVLLAEADARRAGLAVVAGTTTRLGLSDLAREVADGHAPGEPFVELEDGVRLVASDPRRVTEPAPAQLDALLHDARSAHGLVIVDCGTAWPMADRVLDAATHIIWTIKASRAAVVHARRLMASDALPTPGRHREALVAVAADRLTRASVRELRRLAGERCDRLVLVPHSDALARCEFFEVSAALGRALAGIGHVLRSHP